MRYQKQKNQSNFGGEKEIISQSLFPPPQKPSFTRGNK